MLFGIYLIQDKLFFQQWLSYQSYMQNLEKKNAIKLALMFGIAP